MVFLEIVERYYTTSRNINGREIQIPRVIKGRLVFKPFVNKRQRYLFEELSYEFDEIFEDEIPY